MKKDEFISLIKSNQNLIFKVCYSYCKDPENRKDLQQEILMQLWSSFSKFDGRVKISTWMYTIALNTAISYYRNDAKINDKKVRMDESLISIPDVHFNEEQDENIRLLYQFIGSLHELDKALILLYLDENKYKEIGEILGISETNVATKINRIKKQLKEKFSNH